MSSRYIAVGLYSLRGVPLYMVASDASSQAAF